MGEMVQINLRAGTDQKARWEAYVEETGRFASLSELIRASVEAEIQSDDAAQAAPTPALASDIQQLQEELSAVRKHVAWLREQEQTTVDISSLAQSVFDELEPLPDEDTPIQVPDDVAMDAEEYQRFRQAQAVIEPSNADEPAPQTASALADRLDTTPQRIADAIELGSPASTRTAISIGAPQSASRKDSRTQGTSSGRLAASS